MEDIRDFFDRQLGCWPAVSQRYSDLQGVKVHDFGTVKVQFNPARIVSTGARIDRKTLAERPCFLCRSNRPQEQLVQIVTDRTGNGTMELLVNPYPILPQHFTIPLTTHEKQSILPHFIEIIRLLEKFPQLLVFYNGPLCGASAPDHMHLQAGTSGIVPVQTRWNELKQTIKRRISADNGATVGLVEGYVSPIFAIQAPDSDSSEMLFHRLYAAMAENMSADSAVADIAGGLPEPMMNIAAWHEPADSTGNGYITLVFPRAKHRPACYGSEQKGQYLVSPGALDMAGLIITPREEDFESLDETAINSILSEVSITESQAMSIIRSLERQDALPVVRDSITVGIVSGRKISFSLNGRYSIKGDGKEENADEMGKNQEAVLTDGKIVWQGKQYDELLFTPADGSDDTGTGASFTLNDVVIGVNFHWQRTQQQTFRGTLRLIIDGDRIYAVNELPVEQYLESVISSEMSATSSLELLKAHAVISRSWLMAQIVSAGRKAARPRHTEQTAGDTLIRWYDREDHTLFDVCADDHCQRYQGITNAANPHVVRAVKETRGQVLAYGSEICDARFSKCCGGKTEEYRYCWDNISVPYLRSVSDPYCNTQDRAILSEVLNDYDQETPDFHDWQVSYSQEQLSSLIKKKLGIDFGRIRAMEPVERGKSGRISQLRITGEKQSLTIGKELEIRKALSETHLYSSWFDVVTDGTDNDGYPERFTLIGKGWGHGVGLCQIGAAVMGAMGTGYRDILSHYYSGAEIRLTETSRP